MSRRLRSEKIRYKYFILIMSLSIFPLFLLGFLSYNIAKDTLLNNQQQTVQNHLETSSEVADLLFKNVINIGRLITWNKDVQQELKSSSIYEAKVLDSGTIKRLRDLISGYLIDTQNIDSVCLFNIHHRSICYGSSKSIGYYGNGSVHQEIADTDWYERAVQKDGRVVFFSNNVLMQGEANDTFSSVKLLKDSEQLFSSQVIGLLVINMKKSMFSNVFNESANSSFIVLDASQEGVKAVYHTPSFLHEGEVLKDDMPATFSKLQQEGYLITSDINETTGWTFAHVVQKNELLKQSNQIGIVTAFIASIIGLVSLFLSFMLSETVSRPLVRLRKLALDWTKGWISSKEEPDEDEINAIGETFERISGENKQLNEQLIRVQLKEREAELRALQAQIKPHFLYNTLDSMYWMAALQNNHEVANMAIALSKSFKLSLNNGKDIIPVSQELEHIQHYMTIQNIRYNNRFQYVEEIEPALLETDMLKLLLQPLVENAIYHGLEPKIGKGTITLTGRIENGWVRFSVHDDGVGVADMKAVHTGYGLQNVKERLALCYGDDSELIIRSVVHEGTSVEIRFREQRRGIDVESSVV